MKRILIVAIMFIATINAVAQQVGDKVSFVATDGRTYTGSIQQIQADRYRVRYDGSNFEAWLTANQFTVMNVIVENGYKVWVKTGPCPGRFDWIAVSKENPAYGGGGGEWLIANLVFGENGMACTKINSSCSFSAATTEAGILRISDKFFGYCCKQYYVWENVQTRKRTVVLGSGSPGFGWQPVERGPYCCEEAETLAGIPGACSGTVQKNICWPGSYAVVVDKQTNKIECYCNPGLVWNSTKTACVDPQDLVKTADCSVYPGSYAAWNAQTQKVECWCPTGKKWNSTMTACVDVTDNESNNGNNKQGTNNCSEYAASIFEKMKGTWKQTDVFTDLEQVTIEGTCDKMTGTARSSKNCLDNSQENIGTMTGHMDQQGVLHIHFVFPDGSFNTAKKGRNFEYDKDVTLDSFTNSTVSPFPSCYIGNNKWIKVR